MKICEYQHDPCKVEHCKLVESNKNLKNCALYDFLKIIDEELKRYTEEKVRIESLKKSFVEAWNNKKEKRESVAIGRATGDAFAKWVIEQAGLHGKSEKDKKVKFGPVDFTVDYVIPSAQNPKVILEIKKNSDIQHTFALKGLLDYSPKYRKLGYITFKERENSKVVKLLEEFKSDPKYKSRFNYFIITGPNGWSKTIENLKVFCNIITS
ncbi:MAG: hypothetical protein ACP5LB_05145 [Candidatus Bathyarchaeia archaeon]